MAGGWRKGMDRRLVKDLPLTPRVVEDHLKGNVFIGLYSLLRDNTCHFLAADFDGPTAMLDALAYVKAARANGVPAALELSQSGARRPCVGVLHREGSGLRGAVGGHSVDPRGDRVTRLDGPALLRPKFYELQRPRKSTWDTPRFVRGYDITLDDRLVLPRGLRHTVTGIVETAGSRLAITDTRNAGSEIEVGFTAALKPEQAVAVSAMLAHDDGVLVAPPGSGKTVMACAIIAERATSTLVLGEP